MSLELVGCDGHSHRQAAVLLEGTVDRPLVLLGRCLSLD